MRALAVVVVVGLTLGCEARLSLGSRCTRSSDCPSPYACVLGSCRVECVSDADCPRGVHCVAVDGAGVCTFEAEERCTAGVCPAPLSCEGGVCRAVCTADGDCLASQRCEGTVCVGRAPVDGGTDAAADAGSGYAPARLCSADGECADGEVCVSEVAPSVCRRACTVHGDCPGSACVPFRADVDGGVVLACATVCEPGTDLGCPAGLACRMILREESVVPGGPSAYTACQPYRPGAEHGCPCNQLLVSTDCSATTSCEQPPEGRQCLRVCPMGTECEPGVDCVATPRSVVRGGIQWGVCPVPATAPTGCPAP